MPELKTSEPLHFTEVLKEEGSGWGTAKTDGHPATLKTNREELISEAGRFKRENALVIVQYAERNDKPNPRGGFFHDFYLYGSKPAPQQNGNQASDDDDGITRVKSTKPETAPEEAWRISLSVGTERAIQLAPNIQQEVTWPFIWALSYEIAARIFLTPPPKLGDLDPLPAGVSGAYSDPTEPPGDDDIPFLCLDDLRDQAFASSAVAVIA